jgi:hypothetical protein
VGFELTTLVVIGTDGIGSKIQLPHDHDHDSFLHCTKIHNKSSNLAKNGCAMNKNTFQQVFYDNYILIVRYVYCVIGFIKYLETPSLLTAFLGIT